MTEKTIPALGEKYYRFRQSGGLDVYVIPKDFATYYATLTTKYGSVDNCFKRETDMEFTTVPNGIAHFLEHKMFESADGTDTFASYAKLGADANAFTSFINTSYLFSCTDNFYEALELLLDSVYHPYFTNENVAKEQGIIGEEICMLNDTPGFRLTFNMLAGMYKEHAVKINIGGSIESIAEINPELLYTCYKAFYNPSNMVLVLCGNIDVERVRQTVEEHVPKSRPVKTQRRYPHESAEVVMPYVEDVMDVSAPIFALGIKDVNIPVTAHGRMAKEAALSVTLEALFGPSSPIYNELYERGDIRGNLSSSHGLCEAFSFVEISGESDDPTSAVEKIREYIDRIKEDGLDPELFERAKKVVYAQTVKSFDSSEEINTLFMSNIIDGVDIFDMPEQLSHVTKDICDSLIRSLFAPESQTVSVIRPEKEKK